MNEPKYQIGEAVYVDFEGELEGILVKVRKHLWVFGVKHAFNESGMFKEEFTYLLCENPSVKHGHPGKKYELAEGLIAGPVEPVIAEVAKARAEKQTSEEQYAKNIIDALSKHHDTPYVKREGADEP